MSINCIDNKPRSVSQQYGVLTMDKSEKLTGWFRFFLAVIIAFGEMLADEFFYVFLCVKYFVMNGYVGQFSGRAVALQSALAYIQQLT